MTVTTSFIWVGGDLGSEDDILSTGRILWEEMLQSGDTRTGMRAKRGTWTVSNSVSVQNIVL